MSKRIRGSYNYALYKSAYTLLLLLLYTRESTISYHIVYHHVCAVLLCLV